MDSRKRKRIGENGEKNAMLSPIGKETRKIGLRAVIYSGGRRGYEVTCDKMGLV